MASLTAYKGLQVVTPAPTGTGGGAIQDDLKLLVDWSPKSVWAQTSDPTSSNNSSPGQDYNPGSLWLRVDTTPRKLFVCQSSTTSTATWLQIPLELIQDASPQLGADLDVNGKKIVSASNGNIQLSPNGNGNILLSPSGTGSVQVGTIGSLNSLFCVNGPITTTVRKISSSDSLADSDSILICDPTAANMTVTVPAASAAKGRCYYVKKANTNARTITLNPVSGSIDNAATRVLNTNYESVTIVSDGADWWVV